MKIKKFLESFESDSLKFDLKNFFIDFIDDETLEITQISDGDSEQYKLIFNFNLPKISSDMGVIENLIKISDNLKEIKNCVHRLKEFYPEIDVSFEDTISLKNVVNYSVSIIDNTDVDYEELNYSNFELKMENKVEISKEDIVRVYNKLMEQKDSYLQKPETLFKGYLNGEMVFSERDRYILGIDDNLKISYLVASLSIANIIIFDEVIINKIKGDKFIIVCPDLQRYNRNRFYLLDSSKMESFLGKKIKENLLYLSQKHSRLKKFL